LDGIRKLALGKNFTCALSESRTVSCWGDGEYGQLGDGTTVAKSTPTAVIWP
jgi:alpha-tubulin suppressor-like RCC1 family protein